MFSRKHNCCDSGCDTCNSGCGGGCGGCGSGYGGAYGGAAPALGPPPAGVVPPGKPPEQLKKLPAGDDKGKDKDNKDNKDNKEVSTRNLSAPIVVTPTAAKVETEAKNPY